jgi:hypothetical protein
VRVAGTVGAIDQPPTAPPPHRVSAWLLVRGLPRDPHASPHLMAMLVSAVATVLLVRAFLALAGYPQIGGGGLHVAHVLWGGLLMLAGLVLLLSFAGPVVRPVAAVLSGMGLGLFIDEVGKFVTSDNNYFYRPAAALMYVVLAGLVLVVHLMHGRRPHHPSEHLAAAVDQTVAGVVGGFTPRRRTEVHAQLRRARGAPGVDEARALVRAVPDDPVELLRPVRLVNVRRLGHRLRRRLGTGRLARHLPAITAAVLVAQVGYAVASFGPPLLARLTGPASARLGPPGALPLALGLVSTLACGALVVVGLVVVRRDRTAGYRWFHRALLVNLLFTRVFQFDVEQFLASVSVLVDVVMLAVVTVALAHRQATRTVLAVRIPDGSG